MNKLLSKCPVCGEALSVTRLECGNCGTEIHGHFEIGRFARLNADDINFVEIFVKNRGNAYKVGEELEMPYSAVRARLSEIISALGYEPPVEAREEMNMPPERRKGILDDLSEGRITSEQAVRMLQGEKE